MSRYGALKKHNSPQVEITVSEDKMEAWADFIPSPDEGPPITYDYVLSSLERYNIVYGILEDRIQEVIMAFNLDKIRVNNVVLARGRLLVNEVMEYMQMNPQLSNASQGRQNIKEQGGRIDHRAYSPFIIVNKNQALAKLNPYKPGQNGTDIQGNSIPFRTIRPESVEGGENTEMKGEFLLSTINGQLVMEKKIMHVRDFLHIKGNVGYRTGNITFPGNVIIDGIVSDGFKIYSGGSITIRQTFDVTDVVAKGDLEVAGGIIGRGQAMVKVGGILNSRFIENCRIACRKAIIVHKDIVNSHVFTLEKIEMSEKSFIIGGEVFSASGIRTGGIGKKGAKLAKIHCGIDFTLMQEDEKNNNMLRLLAAKLDRLKQVMEEPQNQGEKKAEMEEFYRRLKEEQDKASKKAIDLMGRINSDENATIEVYGEICPGTLIEICQAALFVTEPLRRVKISLDRIMSKLIITPL